MKNYVFPEIEVINLADNDIITTSGVESPKTDIGVGYPNSNGEPSYDYPEVDW